MKRRLYPQSTLRTRSARIHPRFDQRAKLLLRPRRGFAARVGMPAPTHQRIVRHVLHHLLQRLAAVALEVFDLRADLTERLADPCHLDRREQPFRMAGNARGIVVVRAMTSDTTHARGAHPTRAT